MLVASGKNIPAEFIDCCYGLSKTTGMNLRLTYVCPSEAGSSAYLGHAYVGAHANHLKDSLRLWHEDSAQKALDKNLAGLEGKSRFTTSVRTGDIASAIFTDAAQCGASLIICSAQKESYKSMFKGSSTSLSLLTGSRLPVLVLPDKGGSLPDFSKDLKIIVADDLETTPQAALGVACQFAAAIGHVTLYHVHVTDEEKELRGYIARLKMAMNLSQIPYDEAVSEESAMENFRASLKEKMHARMSPYQETLEKASCHLEVKVLAGQVTEALSGFRDSVGADMLVFGRHSFVHSKPFGIGKLPFRAMMEMKSPVMMVPPL